ncbi:hypothetical protein OA871_00130 [Paracoccaceae bacterium]|nr:hypothetical protein [Paracoccaceae bacterium]OUU31415.1 MAG: hypothetical protein CBB97_00200 [Candidatus Endolissoclinum sp. TMED37]|tara:strand:+ start:486 stop:839 length:354 start_codon:yes stop_codon:yes gene_type:complete
MSKWEYITVTKKQWQDLIKLVEDKELQMFVIRSWANAQTVSLASILAFKGEIQTSYKDREAAKNILGPITVALRKVTKSSKATCYSWNWVKGEWAISHSSFVNLRKALGHPEPTERW